MKELVIEMNLYIKLKPGESKEEAFARFEKELSDYEYQVWNYEVQEV